MSELDQLLSPITTKELAMSIIFFLAGLSAVWLAKFSRRWIDRLLFSIWQLRDRKKLDRRFRHQPERRNLTSELGSLGDQPENPALFIKEIQLINIRCFSEIKIRFGQGLKPYQQISILGDNSLGKSTLLKAIALVFCNESDAITLINTMQGQILTKGKTKGFIKARLVNSKTGATYSVDKQITQMLDGEEKVRQLSPALPFKNVFICGYGTQRTRTAQTSFEKYSPGDALNSLFDDSSNLQNPEVVLLRSDEKLRSIIQEKLLDILLLEDDANQIIADHGISFQGPWGSVSFPSLSDGYRSTSQWMLDLLAWMIYAGKIPASGEPSGVLLIDEIEQHLHPKWQRHILQRISRQFPNLQIITTTHTPLIASSTADLDQSILLKLSRIDGQIICDTIAPKALKGQRADQVLTSIFDLSTSKSPGSAGSFPRYVELTNKPSLTPEEAEELVELKKEAAHSTRFGESDLERNVERAVNETLDRMIRKSPDAMDEEVKRQLKALFDEPDSTDD